MMDVVDIALELAKSERPTTRKELYAKFNGSADADTLVSSDGTKHVKNLVSAAVKDVNESKCTDLVSEALQTLIICLNFDNLVRLLDNDSGRSVITCLCACVRTTSDKVSCQRSLFCIATQKLPDVVIQNQVEEIVEVLEVAIEKWKGQSMTVENEILNVIHRVVVQASKQMSGLSPRWAPIMVSMVTHKAIKVRENALEVLKATLDCARTQQKELAAMLKQPGKQVILPGLRKLFQENHQVYVLESWSALVQLIGKELHSSSHINDFLPIVELGFKSVSPDTKIAAFQGWQHLIDNFASNPAVLQDPKRIKLVMQVFKHNNARTEGVAVVKMKVWWHFIWLLGTKVTPNFDMVAAPLLQFCVGGRSSSMTHGSTPQGLKAGASPLTPHLKLTSPPSMQLPVFTSLQLMGCEALAHFLGPLQDPHTSHTFQLDALRHELVSGPSFFIKQSSLFISIATELMCNLGNTIPDILVLHIWQWLLVHLKNAIESPVKLDIRDTLTTLLMQFQVIVLSRKLYCGLILKMFEGLCSLPKKVLCSTAYSVGEGEMVNGTPALFILSLLLTPNLIESCSSLESYHSLYASLVAVGLSPTPASLGFLQSALEIVGRNVEFVGSKEIVWRLWSGIVNPLLEHINKSNEVNQGDSLEHNFSSCTQALTFPVLHRLHDMPQASVKTLVKTWSELYRTVARLAALVTSAESNVVCEEVCLPILDQRKSHTQSVASEVDMLVQMCHVMVNSLDFSALSNQSTFNLASSPKKWVKRKSHPLGNIHHLVNLLAVLQKQALTLNGDTESFKNTHSVPLQSMFNLLVDSFCALFTQTTSSSVISNLIGRLAQPIGELFTDASKKASKVFNNPFQQKLETLWADICTCLQGRYTGMFDSAFLAQLSPMLESTFLHSRRQIKNQTLSLWGSTFSKAGTLEYPEALKPVLVKVREKSTVQLPGFVTTDAANVSVIEETPISQMSQTQAPEARIPGMPSPHKIYGSFLNKPTSPKPSVSPVRNAMPVSPKMTNSAKKKMMNLDGFKEDEFVVIKYSPKKKMVLTDHQKEMMKEKRVMPAMYNSLENSMDASLMAAHFSTDTQMTQMDGTCSETPTPTSQPFSLFGSIIPPTDQSKQIHSSNSVKTRSKRKAKAASLSPPDPAKSNEDSTSDSQMKTRRSVRFKESKDQSKESQVSPEVSIGKKKGDKRASKKESKDNKTVENDECVVINDSESQVESSGVNTVENPDKILENVSEKSIEEAKKTESDSVQNAHKTESQIDLTVDSQVADKDMETQKEKSQSAINTENEELKSGKSSASQKSVDSFVASVPQNVLGAVGFTQISSKSSDPKSSCSEELSVIKDSIESTKDGKAESVNEADNKEMETEKALSDPLFNWTQKLSQLSQSPLRKPSSLDSTKSPSKQSRSRSPMKSPRKGRKKSGNENEIGALDKWLIRSPAKTVVFPEKGPDEIIVAQLSQSLVEETQSPTKFTKTKKKDDKDLGELSPSIMETPPKNVLENIPVNHGNSNRKLFSSQGSNAGGSDLMDTVEDSNMVPASPNSKSFTVRTGTPVLKIKKLTQEEILRYSPSRKDSQDSYLTPSKGEQMDRDISGSQRKVKCLLMTDGTLHEESSHEHDDFSVFKPLDGEKAKSEADTLANKSLTSTDQAMLKIDTGVEIPISTTEAVTNENCSENENPFGSQELFTQDRLTDSGGNNKDVTKENVDGGGSQISVEDLLGSEASENVSQLENSSQSDNSQTDTDQVESDVCSSQTAGKPNSDGIGVNTTPGKSRKRKQITPRKMTPEDSKKKRKAKKDTKDEENKGSARKVSKRLKDKKENSAESKDSVENKMADSEKAAMIDNKKNYENSETVVNNDKKEGEVEKISDEITACNDQNGKGQGPKVVDKKTEKSQSQGTGKRRGRKPKVKETGSESLKNELESFKTESEGFKSDGMKTESEGLESESESMKTESEGNAKEQFVEEPMDVDAEMAEPVLNLEQEIRKSVSEAEDMDIENDNDAGDKTEGTNDSQVRIEEKPVKRRTRKNLRLNKQKETSDKASKSNDAHENDSENQENDKNNDNIGDSIDDVDKEDAKAVTEATTRVGQKTPESKGTTRSQPARRSTTKHKKEVAQKMVNKRSKDVEIVINDADSNLDVEDCLDKEQVHLQNEHVARKLENGLDDAEVEDSKEKNDDKKTSKSKTDDVKLETENTSFSDDDLPLSDLTKNVKNVGDSKETSNKTESPMSPVAGKLRSSAQKKTRLRSGDKKKQTSPQAKKSVSLALKRTRSSESKQKLVKTESLKDTATDTKAIEGESKVNAIEENITEENSKKNVDTAVEAKKTEEVLKISTKLVGPGKASDDLLLNDQLKETPRKGEEAVGKTSVASVLMMRNSDSKLILGSRKFPKRSSIARRSILKPTSVGSAGDASSPVRVKDFHPITISRIYSPTASPSASILKKRRLSDDPGSDTYSPPAKQRRVSFATPLIDVDNSLLPGNTAEKLANTGTSDTNNQLLSTPTSSKSKSATLIATRNENKNEDEATSLTPSRHAGVTSQSQLESQSTVGTPSQLVYESSQESQLDTSEPVCRELIDCNQSVEKVLPQLTSSIWSRGLGQLVRARNIHTIGDLSALTETDVHSLPIRSPKVETVRKVLNKFGQSLQTSRAKLWGSPRVGLEKSVKIDQTSSSSKPDTVNNTDQPSTENTGKESQEVEAILAGSADLIDEVNRLSERSDQSDASKKSCDSTFQSEVVTEETMDQSETSVQNLNSADSSRNILKDCLTLLSKADISRDVQKLKNNDLVELNKVLTDIQSEIVTELRSRCSTSPSQ